MDIHTTPPEYRRDPDWHVVFNPKVKKALDVQLVHGLIMHESVVCCVRFSPDGKNLATGCNRTAHSYWAGGAAAEMVYAANSEQIEDMIHLLGLTGGATEFVGGLGRKEFLELHLGDSVDIVYYDSDVIQVSLLRRVVIQQPGGFGDTSYRDDDYDYDSDDSHNGVGSEHEYSDSASYTGYIDTTMATMGSIENESAVTNLAKMTV
ncbi:hypothetical protein F5887DRAFT_1283883 [Amanita rubescens]|nr:hypothetical protein F5887DRAFT_1283883 [Amanita rubescens]